MGLQGVHVKKSLLKALLQVLQLTQKPEKVASKNSCMKQDHNGSGVLTDDSVVAVAIGG